MTLYSARRDAGLVMTSTTEVGAGKDLSGFATFSVSQAAWQGRGDKP